MRASGTCIELLDLALSKSDSVLRDVRLFVADSGPGSFVGIRVGITLAKSLGKVLGRQCASISAFDLIDPSRAAAIPRRKGEWWLRLPGEEPLAVSDDALLRRLAIDSSGARAVSGYGSQFSEPTFPIADRAGPLLQLLRPEAPEALLPMYLAEPSISTPKRPFGLAPGAGRA